MSPSAGGLKRSVRSDVTLDSSILSPLGESHLSGAAQIYLYPAVAHLRPGARKFDFNAKTLFFSA